MEIIEKDEMLNAANDFISKHPNDQTYTALIECNTCYNKAYYDYGTTDIMDVIDEAELVDYDPGENQIIIETLDSKYTIYTI